MKWEARLKSRELKRTKGKECKSRGVQGNEGSGHGNGAKGSEGKCQETLGHAGKTCKGSEVQIPGTTEGLLSGIRPSTPCHRPMKGPCVQKQVFFGGCLILDNTPSIASIIPDDADDACWRCETLIAESEGETQGNRSDWT